MTEFLRWVLLVLATIGLALSFTTWAIRRHLLPEQTRNRAVAVVPIMAAIDYGAVYALANHLPLNKGLWVTVPALVIFDVVWGYYFVRDARR